MRRSRPSPAGFGLLFLVGRFLSAAGPAFAPLGPCCAGAFPPKVCGIRSVLVLGRSLSLGPPAGRSLSPAGLGGALGLPRGPWPWPALTPSHPESS